LISSTSGRITGTPTTAGNYFVTAAATNSRRRFHDAALYVDDHRPDHRHPATLERWHPGGGIGTSAAVERWDAGWRHYRHSSALERWQTLAAVAVAVSEPLRLRVAATPVVVAELARLRQ
jgi:hypothetical protein